jgi:hypothetical protein
MSNGNATLAILKNFLITIALAFKRQKKLKSQGRPQPGQCGLRDRTGLVCPLTQHRVHGFGLGH